MNWIIVSVLAIAALGVGFAVKDRLQLRRRPGLTKAQFVAIFRGEAIPEKLVCAVYDCYTSVVLGDGVAITPDDDFETLRVSQDDLDDSLQSLLTELGLGLPSSAGIRSPVNSFACFIHAPT